MVVIMPYLVLWKDVKFGMILAVWSCVKGEKEKRMNLDEFERNP